MAWHETHTYMKEQIEISTGIVTKKQINAKHKKWYTYWSNKLRQHGTPRQNFLGAWYTPGFSSDFDPSRYINKWYGWDSYEYFLARKSYKSKR